MKVETIQRYIKQQKLNLNPNTFEGIDEAMVHMTSNRYLSVLKPWKVLNIDDVEEQEDEEGNVIGHYQFMSIGGEIIVPYRYILEASDEGEETDHSVFYDLIEESVKLSPEVKRMIGRFDNASEEYITITEITKLEFPIAYMTIEISINGTLIDE